jgi:DNA-binding winged helix-turn-helix (wHTH) protein
MRDPVRYRFGPFVLEPALRRLRRDSNEVALPPKAFDLLVLLVRSRDRVLTKLDLLDDVWRHTAVTDNTVAQRIREIREALDDNARRPRYVRTVSRVGYRFVGEVTEDVIASQERQAPGVGQARDSLARPADASGLGHVRWANRSRTAMRGGRVASAPGPAGSRRSPLTIVRARQDVFNVGLLPDKRSARKP